MPLVVSSQFQVQRRLAKVKVLCTLAFYLFVGYIFLLTTKHLKDPFIDEIFHLRQCQVYCAYNFSIWDNKITTPPGLYILGLIYTKLLEFITMTHGLCQNDNVLRSLNLSGGLLALPFIAKNIKQSNANRFWTVNIIAQPLLFTYYSLFYTDVWSTVLVLGSLAFVTTRSKQHPIWSAQLGFASLWLRQTNIVWLAFIATIYIDRQIVRDSGVCNRIIQFVKTTFKSHLQLLGYIVNFALFALFIKYNGGITFGDKDNHKVQLHLVQIFYCFTFVNFFTWPIWLSRKTLSLYIRFLVGNYGINLVFNMLASWAIFYIINNFTIVHPFLLADNRHYTFYIFRRLLNTKYSTYLAVPVYHFVTYNCVATLYRAGHQFGLSPILILGFITATILTITPSPLFEPRYYIVPLLIFRLFIAPSTGYANLLEFIWLNIINAITSLVFFNYTFTWWSEPGKIQRIIW